MLDVQAEVGVCASVSPPFVMVLRSLGVQPSTVAFLPQGLSSVVRYWVVREMDAAERCRL